MSMTNLAKLATIVALTAMVGVGLTACSTPTTVSTETSTLVGPTIETLTDLQGSTITIEKSKELVINTDSIDPTVVMVQDTDAVDNPNDKVVQFMAGGMSGSSVNNPSFKAVGAGKAHIVLVNSENGEVLADFTIVVP